MLHFCKSFPFPSPLNLLYVRPGCMKSEWSYFSIICKVATCCFWDCESWWSGLNLKPQQASKVQQLWFPLFKVKYSNRRLVWSLAGLNMMVGMAGNCPRGNCGWAYRDKVLARYHDCFSKCWSGASACCQQTAGSNPRARHLQPPLLQWAARWQHTSPAHTHTHTRRGRKRCCNAARRSKPFTQVGVGSSWPQSGLSRRKPARFHHRLQFAGSTNTAAADSSFQPISLDPFKITIMTVWIICRAMFAYWRGKHDLSSYRINQSEATDEIWSDGGLNPITAVDKMCFCAECQSTLLLFYFHIPSSESWLHALFMLQW